MRYKAVLFDFDYTLGDATEAIYAGFCHAFREMGLPPADREGVRRTVGMLVVDAYTQLTGDADEGRRDLFYRLFHPVARDLQAQGMVELFPGAAELLAGLRAAGMPAGIVSTKNNDSLSVLAEKKGLAPYLSCIVGGGSVSRHKPDPEGLLLALNTLGVSPAEALFCGDTVIDARTAQNAGADFCAVLNGTTPADAFTALPHVHISPDLWELKSWLNV